MLFQVKQKYDEDDLWALHNVEAKKYRIHQGVEAYLRICALMGILVLIGAAVGIIVWAVQSFGGQKFLFVIFLALLWGLFIPNAIRMLARVAFAYTKEIDEDSLKECKERTYTFFDDHFTIEDDNSTVENQYSVVTKFIEKEEHFFIYIAVNVAYVIRKSCFVVGTPEEFGSFMREKYRTKDMNTPEKGLDQP